MVGSDLHIDIFRLGTGNGSISKKGWTIETDLKQEGMG
jgi:hypothetical protein